MASERVTIQVESNIGEDGPLTVMDALHQFMDAFEFLSAAIAQEPGGDTVRWRLISLSKNSPATATAEAYSDASGVAVAPLVFRGKRRFSDGLTALAEGRVESWIESSSFVAKALFRRNLNGVGRTIFDLDDAPRAVVVERVARQALAAIESHEATSAAQEDLSRAEYGSIDANVAEAKTYHGQPALYVRDRLTGRVIPCVLTEQAAEEAGPAHSWQDAWQGRRIRAKGQIFYDRTGQISRIRALSIVDVNPQPVSIADMRKIDFLNSKSPPDHMDELWGYSK